MQKKMYRRVISCLCMDYVLFFKVKKKYSQRGNQHQDVAQKTMEVGKEVISWFAPKDDPAQEFECYVPAYVCLAVLGFVSYPL